MNMLVIRADSTEQIGTGHVMRCLALVQAWRERGNRVLFISHCRSDTLRKRIMSEGVDFQPLMKMHPDSFDIDFTISMLNRVKAQNSKSKIWLVVDGYHFDADYQKRIRDADYRLLWIDDYGHANHYWANILLNQNITASDSLYENRESCTHLMLGTQYILLRKEFSSWRGWQRNIKAVGKRILVTMGGADPGNVTCKVLEAIEGMTVPDLEIKIIVGPANPYRGKIIDIIRRLTFPSQCLESISNMPELMAWADIAISAGGSTCWELAFMGLPSCHVVLADNQVKVANALHDLGVSINLGWFHTIDLSRLGQVVKDLLADQQRRRAMSNQGKLCVDGNGAQSVVNAICEYY